MPVKDITFLICYSFGIVLFLLWLASWHYIAKLPPEPPSPIITNRYRIKRALRLSYYITAFMLLFSLLMVFSLMLLEGGFQNPVPIILVFFCFSLPIQLIIITTYYSRDGAAEMTLDFIDKFLLKLKSRKNIRK